MPTVGDALKLSIVITSVDRFSRTFDLINRRIESMASGLNSKAGRAIKSLEKQYEDSGKKLSETFKYMHNEINKTLESARKWETWGVAMTRAGIALGVATAGVVNVSAKLEDKMTRVQSITNESNEFIEQLTAHILDLGTRVPIATEELADLALVSGQLGLRGDDLNEFVETVAMIASINKELSTEMWAEYLAKFRNMFGLSTDELENFSSMLAQLADKTPAKAGEIAQAIFRVGKIAEGLTAQDIATVSTALIQVGMTAERAGTAARRLFIDLADVNKLRKIVALTEYGYDMAQFEYLKESAPDAGSVVKELYSLGSIVPEDKLRAYQVAYMKDPLKLLMTVLSDFAEMANKQIELVGGNVDFSNLFDEATMTDLEGLFDITDALMTNLSELGLDVPLESSIRDIFNIRGTEAVTKLKNQVENIAKIRDIAYEAWPTPMFSAEKIVESIADAMSKANISPETFYKLSEEINKMVVEAVETGTLGDAEGIKSLAVKIDASLQAYGIDTTEVDEQMANLSQAYEISILQQKFGIRTKSMAAQMIMARNAIVEALYGIGIALKPLIVRISNVITKIAKGFASLPPFIRAGLAGFMFWGSVSLVTAGVLFRIVALVKRIKALLMAKELLTRLGVLSGKDGLLFKMQYGFLLAKEKLALFGTKVAGVGKLLVSGIGKGLTTVVKGFKAVFTFLIANPYILVIAAIALAIYGIIQLITHWGEVVKWLGNLWSNIKSIATTVVNYMYNIFKPLIDWLVNAFSGAIDLILDAVSGIVGMSIKGLKAVGVDVELPEWISDRWAKEQYEKLGGITQKYVNDLLGVSDAANAPFAQMMRRVFANMPVKDIDTAIELIKTFNEAVFEGETKTYAGTLKLIERIQEIAGISPILTEAERRIQDIVSNLETETPSVTLFDSGLAIEIGQKGIVNALQQATYTELERQQTDALERAKAKIEELGYALSNMANLDQKALEANLINVVHDWWNTLDGFEKDVNSLEISQMINKALIDGIINIKDLTTERFKLLNELPFDKGIFRSKVKAFIDETKKEVKRITDIGNFMIDVNAEVSPNYLDDYISKLSEIASISSTQPLDIALSKFRKSVIGNIPLGSIKDVILGATTSLDAGMKIITGIGGKNIDIANKVYTALSDAEKVAMQTSIVEAIAKALSNTTKIDDEMESLTSEIMSFLPQSPPKQGPLKKLFDSGIKIVQILRDGIESGKGQAQEVMESLGESMTKTLDTTLNQQTAYVLSRFFKALKMDKAIGDINNLLKTLYALERSDIGKAINAGTDNVLTKIVGGVQSVLGGKIGDLSGIITTFGTAIGADLTGVAAALGPIGIAIAGITAAFAIFGDQQWFRDLTNPILEELSKVWDIVSSIFKPIGEIVSAIAPALGKALVFALKAIVFMNPIIMTLVTGAKVLFKTINRVFEGAKKVFAPMKKIIDSVFKPLENAFEPLRVAFSELFEVIKPLIDSGLDAIISVILIPLKILATVLTPIVKVFASIIEKIAGAIKGIADVIKWVIEKFQEVLGSIKGATKEKKPWWSFLFPAIDRIVEYENPEKPIEIQNLSPVKTSNVIEEKPVLVPVANKVEEKPIVVQTINKTEEKPIVISTVNNAVERPIVVPTVNKVEEKPIAVPTANRIEERPITVRIVSNIEEKPIVVPIASKGSEEPIGNSIVKNGTNNFKGFFAPAEHKESRSDSKSQVVVQNTFNIQSDDPERVWRFIQRKLDLEALKSR